MRFVNLALRQSQDPLDCFGKPPEQDLYPFRIILVDNVIEMLNVRWNIVVASGDQYDGFANHVSHADLVKDVRVLLGAIGNDQVGAKNAVPNLVDKGFCSIPLISSYNCDTELLTK